MQRAHGVTPAFPLLALLAGLLAGCAGGPEPAAGAAGGPGKPGGAAAAATVVLPSDRLPEPEDAPSLDAAVLAELRASPEYWVLAGSDSFRGPNMGRGDSGPGEEAIAFRLLLERPDADDAFLDLLRTAPRLPGRLYALCGLWLLDRDRYARAVRPYATMERTIADWATKGPAAQVAVKDIVRSPRIMTVRLKGFDDTIEDWLERNELNPSPEILAGWLDIAGGGFPVALRDSAPAEEEPRPARKKSAREPGEAAKWIAEIPRNRKAAAEALIRLGPRAVSDLEVALADGNPLVRSAAIEVLEALGPNRLGARTVEVGTLIAGLLADPKAGKGAKRCLESFGPWAVGGLLAFEADVRAIGPEGIEEGDSEVGIRCDLLAGVGPRAAPHLQRLLDHASAQVRSAVLNALRRLGPFAAGSLAATLECLRDEDAKVRAAAALAAGAMGSGRGDLAAGEEALGKAIDSLSAVLRDPEPAVRAAACTALARIGPAAAGQAARLRRLRNDPDAGVRREAAIALWKAANEQARVVAAVLEDDGPWIGGAPDPLAPWYPDLDPVDLLRDIALASAGAFRDLQAAAGDPRSPRRILAIYAIGAMGPPAAEAAPALRGMLADPDPDVRFAAAEAIADIALDPGPAMRIHLDALERGDGEERREAARAIGRHGIFAREGVAALTKAVEGSDRTLRAIAIDSLAAIGPDAAPAARALARRLTDLDPWIRAGALDALARIGPRARLALPAARKAVGDGDPVVRWAARIAVAKMEGRRGVE